MTFFKTSIANFFIVFTFILIGSSSNSVLSATKSLFDTEAEAEKAAKNFNCIGAHKMADKWMHCEKHEDHEILEKKNTQEGHGHHHNH